MNKQLIIAFLAICFLQNATFAQRHSIGPTIGVNFTDMSDVSNSTYKPGMNVGLAYNYSKNEKVGVGVGLRYSQEGTQVEVAGTEGYTQLNYLRIPVKFQYFFGTLEDRFRPKIYVGPSLGVLVDGKYKGTVSTVEVSQRIDRDDYTQLDFGLMGGLGFNYKIQPATWLNFDVAYTHGLIDVSKSAGETANRGVATKIGVTWGF